MKLFSLPDGTIDHKDRAQWVTPPFDKDISAEVIFVGRRVQGDPFASAQVVQHGTSHARIVERTVSNARVKRGN